MGRFVLLFICVAQALCFVTAAQPDPKKKVIVKTTVTPQATVPVYKQATSQPATNQPTNNTSTSKQPVYTKPTTSQPTNSQATGKQPATNQPANDQSTTSQPTNNYSVYNPPAQVIFSGRVFDQKTQYALSGASVQISDGENSQNNLSLRTNSDGAYSFDARKFRTLRINVQMNGYQNYSSQQYQPAVMYRSKNTRFDDIYLTPQTTQPPAQIIFSGRVFDQNTRRPVVGASVLVQDRSGQTQQVLHTNSDGTYNFDVRPFPNLRLQVQMQGYQSYSSPLYQPGSMYKMERNRFDDILLAQETAGNMGGNNSGKQPPNPNQQNTNPWDPRKDSTPVERYLSQKLFTDYHVLATPSSYALYYALNPELKNMNSVPYGYTIRQPRTPDFTSTMKSDFSRRFKYDSEKDPATQSLLQDSINDYFNTYDENVGHWRLKFRDEVNSDSVKQIFSTIKNDLQSYQNKIGSTRRAKATQIANAVSACTQLIRDIATRAEIDRDQYDQLAALGACISDIVQSRSLTNFFKRLYESLSFDQRLQLFNAKRGFEFASHHETDLSGHISTSNYDDFTNDTRAFTVSVHLQLPDGTIVSDGGDITNRYEVVFFPPKLKKIKGLHIPCNPRATFGNVSLYEGKFEQMVIDRTNNREMIIVADDNSFDTRQAFSVSAKQLLGMGDVKFTQIQILVKE